MRLALLLAWKDLLIESRSKRRLSSLFLLSLVLVLLGSFAYRWQGDDAAYLPPLFWLVCVFAQLLFLGDAYNHEVEGGCFDALRISPAGSYQLLAGKLLASMVWVFSVNIVSVLEISLFTGAGQLLRLDILVLLLLESIGLLSIGNLFFARKASGSSTSLDLVPIVVTLALPLVFLSMEISQLTVRNAAQIDVTPYYGLLVAYDLFLVISCSLFYRTLVDE